MIEVELWTVALWLAVMWVVGFTAGIKFARRPLQKSKVRDELST